MPVTLTDEEFVKTWNLYKSASEMAAATGLTQRTVYSRRRKLERKHNIKLVAIDSKTNNFLNVGGQYPNRRHLGIRNGTVLVFSDAHFWPGIRTVAFRGLLWAIKELQPSAVIANGDVFDGASISRFPRILWSRSPSIIEELKACQESLGEIESAVKPNCKLIWTMGNHDARFESKLANSSPYFEGIKGFKLGDHFPKWELCWSVWPTDDVVIKHRFKGGIHATHNNVINAGKSIVTGHLHSLKVTPFSDYGPTRFGVDTGTLADVDGPQFSDYTEQNPLNWRSGFAVLTFHEARLLWPELCHRFTDHSIEFRGKVVEV